MTRLLVSGNGRSGSWKIRGEQLGAAIGATLATTLPRNAVDFDRVIVVKRWNTGILPVARAAGVPVIYDVVDAFQSTLGPDRRREEARRWLADVITVVRPQGIVAATQAMAADCAGFGVPVLTLPHHARPGAVINPIRQRVTRVGYEGSERYLGWWRGFLETECTRRGWSFVVNPAELADVDLLVAVRDDLGYAARHWKSNVKLANAQATGTPCVLNREAGYLETACGAERWADDAGEMRLAFDELTDYAVRFNASGQLTSASAPVALSTIADTYREWLCASNF